MNPTKPPPAPLLWTFIFMAAGIGCSMVFPSLPLFALGSIGILSAVIALALAICKKRKTLLPATIILLLGFTALGAFRYTAWKKVQQNDIRRLNGHEVTVIGDVASEIQLKGDRQRFDFAVDSVLCSNSLYPAFGTIRTYIYNGPSLTYGDRLHITTELEEPRSATNPFAYDFKKDVERRGIGSVAFVHNSRDVQIIERRDGNWLYQHIILPLREHISETIYSGLHGDSAVLLEALLLGRGKELPQRVRAAFADSGTIHILAVSGLHVGLIAGFAWLLFGVILRIPRGIAVGLVIVVLALYAALVGGRPSVLRASIMFAIVTVGIAFRRPPNLLNAIGAAGIVLLIIRPAWLADIGFQLSFGATLGIAYLLPHFDNWVPDKWRRTKFLWKWILLALGVSLSATLGTVPLVAYHFHRIQIIAPLANLLILPPLGLIVGYGIVASIFSAVPFLETVSVFFLYTDWLFLRYLLIATSLFAKLPFCSIAFPHLSGWWIVGYYGILVLLPPIIRRRFRGLGGGVLFLIIVVSAITIARIGANYAPRDELRVTFFDIGQGDCALVELSDGRKMLIDGGPPGNAIFAVEPYLRARGIDKIDAVLITHTDSDHLGGVADLASDFDYDVVYVPYLTTSSVLYAVFLDSTKSAEIPVKIIHAGETIPNFSELTVLWPDTTAVSTVGSLKTSPNEASIVLLLERDEAQFLFTGDIGTATENKLVELWSDIDADILKVPHHGSRYSSSEQFIAATTPLLAIISVGRNNYGHPTPEAIERYTASGTEIIRTDRGGAVTLTIDGDSIFYEQFDGRCGGFSATDQPARVNP